MGKERKQKFKRDGKAAGKGMRKMKDRNEEKK